MVVMVFSSVTGLGLRARLIDGFINVGMVYEHFL